ncbi:PREDICTED: glutathione S-transferase 1-1-like [Eufriesea mexicana]|uniref:glutathione S-transferase 1-1-like n=1 Tax=Eufriesea mexicana TaxID=516756 RepID=UPI00083BD086|nr:PREDICTED: glutathione S-transferase 1-1-like [Eufriesea mexicana]
MSQLTNHVCVVLLTAEAIGISLNLKEINLFTGEHLKPEYEQLNPQKAIPFLVDDEYKLSESRAIMSYLADQYGKNARLNPQTVIGRALVNHRLHFDIGTLYRGMKDYYYPVVFGKEKEYNPDRYKPLEGAFDVLDKFLDGQDYVAGRNLTIADLALVATVSTSEVFGFDVEKYANVAKWLDRIKSSAPGYRKANVEGLEILKKMIEDSKEE